MPPRTLKDIDLGDVSPEHLIKTARKRGCFVFDLETTGLNPKRDRIEGVAFYVPEGPDNDELKAWYPFVENTMRCWVHPEESAEEQRARVRYERTGDKHDHAAWVELRQEPQFVSLIPALNQEETMEALRPLFEESPDCYAVAHNAKFDVAFLRWASGCQRGFWQQISAVDRLAALGRGDVDPGPWGFSTSCRFADSMQADFLCDENYFSYGLKGRVKAVFDHDMVTYTDVMKRRNQGTFGFMSEDVEALGTYAMSDCYWTWRLFEHAMEILNQQTPGEELGNAVDALANLSNRSSRVSPFDRAREMGNLERIYWNIDMNITLILEEMETRGILIDWRWLKKVTEKLEIKKDKIIDEIEKQLGFTINPNSAPQVSTVLFAPPPTGLGLPTKGIARGKTGQYSTGSKEISHLSRVHPVVKLLLDWRSADTVQSNFSIKLANLVADEPDNRCYSHFNQTGTKIHRLSSSDPINLQNLPRDRELIRRAVCAYLEGHDPDLLLFGCDYSQIELRVAAHLSNDLGMIEVYNMVGGCKAIGGSPCERYQHWECDECHNLWIPADSTLAVCPKCGDSKIAHQKRCRHVDLHQRTAEDVGVPRNPLAKNLNFGSLYRIGPERFCQYADLYDDKGLARVEYARGVLDGWYEAYPAIEPFHLRMEATLRKNGWISRTLTGRQRRLDRERYKNEYRAVTQGIQFAVSGSAQDILKVAMVRIWEEKWRRVLNSRPAERKLWSKWNFLLQVHDEIMMEGPPELKDEIVQIMTEKMEGAASLRVPLVTDVKTGRNWDNIH